MPRNRIVLGFLFVALLFLSFNYSNPIKTQILNFSNGIRVFFISQYDRVSTNIHRHFDQTKQIKRLKKELNTLREPANLSSVFATKLNQFLDEANLTEFSPSLKLSRVIAYEELNNPYRMWLEVPNYDENRSYGLIHKGFTAGIVYPKLKKPLAYMQVDKKVIFSVLIGEKKILGVVFGNDESLTIKYIPTYVDVHLGDEVVTSGKDSIFYEGIKVGKITHIERENIYKVATVEPYMKVKNPNFFYVVDVH
jgi:rod shape-determining protein MreC